MRVDQAGLPGCRLTYYQWIILWGIRLEYFPLLQIIFGILINKYNIKVF